MGRHRELNQTKKRTMKTNILIGVLIAIAFLFLFAQNAKRSDQIVDEYVKYLEERESSLNESNTNYLR